MRFEKIILFLMVFSIFMDDFRFGSDANRGALGFDLYYYYVVWIVFLIHFFIRFKSLPKWPAWFLGGILVLFTNSIIAGVFSDSLKFPMLKQFIAITYSATAYFATLQYTKFNLDRLFRIYLKGAFWVAVWGVAEQAFRVLGFHQRFAGSAIEKITRLIGFNNLWDNTKSVSVGLYRVYSIMGEPYFLAVALIPAMHYYMNRMLGPKPVRSWKDYRPFAVILTCYLFTFSSAGYTGLILSLGLVGFNLGLFNLKKTGIIFIPVLLFIVIPKLPELRTAFFELQVRVDDTVKAFTSKTPLNKKELAKLNSSTFALYSNFLIAGEAFAANPITGAGLGSHEISYDRYFDKYMDKILKKMYGKFNTKDANSLFIRLMSEAGIIGLILLFVAVTAFFVGTKGIRNPELYLYTIINQGVFIMMIVRILRTGNYIGQGFYFFFFLYAFSAIFIRRYYNSEEVIVSDELEADDSGGVERILNT